MKAVIDSLARATDGFVHLSNLVALTDWRFSA